MTRDLAVGTDGSRADDASSFEELRPLLRGIAYRMLGTVSDAEDVVQDAYLRYMHALDEGVRIESLKSYLSAVVTRLAIDSLRSARVRRERYVGLWLPEPLLTDHGFVATLDGENTDNDSMSMAFLLLLERLGPVERAVFLLHDVMGYPFERVAEIVGKTAVNCRRIATRARRKVQSGERRFESSREDRERLASRFFAAMTGGDVEALVGMLAHEATVYGDGGGKAPQWSQPIRGVDRVSRLLAGTGRKAADAGLRLELREINGAPGALVLDGSGALLTVYVLEIRDGAVHAFRSVINPDKLRHLGPVADVWALLRSLAERRPAAGSATVPSAGS